MQIRRREDVDPEEGIRKHGKVEFADPVNNKYPIDTPEHVRAAWARIHILRNAMFYSAAEIELIKSRIIEAAKRFGIELSQEVIERDARLFAAGDYPDRGIEITEADLDRMVESHSPAPIRVEHVESPLELGTVTKLWRKGKDLFGRMAFTAPAWDLIEASGAKKLSAAVKRDKSGIVEVSLVRHPRVAGAAVFGADAVGADQCVRPDVIIFGSDINEGIAHEACCFKTTNKNRGLGLESEYQSLTPNPQPPVSKGGIEMSETQAAEFSKRIADLERELRGREVDSQIDALKRAGKLAPASEELARALLLAGESQVVTFSDGTEKPVAETFLAFLESQPKVIEFSELAEGAKEQVAMSEEEREFYARLGVSPEAVGKYKVR